MRKGMWVRGIASAIFTKMVMAATGPRPSERVLISPKAQVTVPVTRASAKPHMGCFRRSTRWAAIGAAPEASALTVFRRWGHLAAPTGASHGEPQS
jgi:hypothetical protein